MQQVNSGVGGVNISEIIGGFKIIQTDVNIKRAVFEDEIVKRPVFVDEPVKVPVGIDKMVNELALEISKAVLALTLDGLAKQIKMLEEKIAALSNVRVEEKLILRNVPVDVEKPNFIERNIPVERPVFIDREVINPVVKNVDVYNAIVIDKAVTNCIVNDIRVTNAIIKDVEVERAVIREKVVEVIHKQCMNEKGEAL